MSTRIANNNSNMGPEVKKNLPAKYMRYMSYTYWLATQLRNADAISADVFNELMKGQKLHATVDVQINHFAMHMGYIHNDIHFGNIMINDSEICTKYESSI